MKLHMIKIVEFVFCRSLSHAYTVIVPALMQRIQEIEKCPTFDTRHKIWAPNTIFRVRKTKTTEPKKWKKKIELIGTKLNIDESGGMFDENYDIIQINCN